MEAAVLNVVSTINSYLSNYVLLILLIGTGLFFTIRTRFVQFRCFGEGWKKMFGNLSLSGFGFGVHRAAYKGETQNLRRRAASTLIPLGGDGVPWVGAWNDRLALARCLRQLPASAALEETIARLEAEAAAGAGLLCVNPRKMRLRLLRLYVEIVLRGWVSPKRRKSAAFARIRAFVRHALWGHKAQKGERT